MKEHPDDALVKMMLGSFYYKAKEFTRAAQVFKEALALELDDFQKGKVRWVGQWVRVSGWVV